MAHRTERSLTKSAENTELHRGYRLLALEVRQGKLGFVVFEGPTKLLDWGVHSYGKGRNHLRTAVGKRVGSSLDLYVPSAVVIRQRSGPAAKVGRRLEIVMRTIRKEARRRSVKFRLLSSEAVQRFFAKHGPATKRHIASMVAEWFEDIAWKLPPKRKSYESEAYNMVIFDAVATGVTFFASRRNGEDQALQ